MAKQILIVDDAIFMRKILRSILEKAGYEIVGEADNGLRALELYPKLMPDLITLDITMPEMDGLETAKNLCSTYPSVKIIMVSAMGQKDMVIGAMVAGAKDFIVKPFEAEKVIQTVRKVI